MSKVFYHWGLEERLLKLALKSNMTLFTRCESLHPLPKTRFGGTNQTLTVLLLPANHRFADRSPLSLPYYFGSPQIDESGEDLGGHVWIDELMRETGGEFLFAKVRLPAPSLIS